MPRLSRFIPALLAAIVAGCSPRAPAPATPPPAAPYPDRSPAASPWHGTIDTCDQFLFRAALVTVAKEHGHRHLRAVLRAALSHGQQPPTSEGATP